MDRSHRPTNPLALALLVLVSLAAPARAQTVRIADALASASAYDNSLGLGRHVDVGFQILARQGHVEWLWSAESVPNSVRIEVTATHLGGPLERGYGVTFARRSREGDQPWCTMYIETSGSYKLRCGTEDVIPWRTHAALARGKGARNRLAIELRGRQVVLFANDTRLDQWTADRDVSGFLGLSLGSEMEVRFEGMRVLDLPPGDMAVGIVPAAVGAATVRIPDRLAEFTAFDTDLGSGQYAKGQVVIVGRRPFAEWLYYYGLIPTGTRIEATVTLVSGPVTRGYGLAFARASREQGSPWCSFYIAGDTSYKIRCGEVDMLPWTRSPALQQGVGAVNRIALELRGRTVTLFANGTQLTQWIADRDVSGYIGFEVGSELNLAFSGLTVYDLPGGAILK